MTSAWRSRLARKSSRIAPTSNKMSLGPGARLGPYEIVSAIGAGGMGEARGQMLRASLVLCPLNAVLTPPLSHRGNESPAKQCERQGFRHRSRYRRGIEACHQAERGGAGGGSVDHATRHRPERCVL